MNTITRDDTIHGVEYVTKQEAEREITELNERLIDRQQTLMAALVKNRTTDSPQCDWKSDEDGYWETSCQRFMCFEYAPPNEQGYKFCHSCGKPINFIEYEPEPPFEDFGGME